MLTPRELQQIREYLLQYGKKDSQFPVVETMTDNDLVAFVRNNQNLAAHLSDIKDFIGTEIAIGGIDIEGITMGLSEKNFSALLEAKLGNIEPDAQVNKLETVKVNGTSLHITDKSVNVELIPTNYVKNYSDPIHPIGELGNQLLGERDINAKIAESEAEFKGTTNPDLTLDQFKTWLGNLTADKNDYIFYVATYTDERIDDEDDKYIYYRYKYTGADEDTEGTPWPCVAGWTYEYQLIPYYLNTDEYPTANSKNAVESQGILAVTGNVPYTESGGVRTYVNIQSQLDALKSYHYTPSLTVSSSYVHRGVATAITATATLRLNSVLQSDFSASTPTNPSGWVVGTASGTTRTFTNTITISDGNQVTVSSTLTQGTYSATASARITPVYPIYYYGSQTASTTLPESYNTASPRGSATGSYNTTLAEGDYFIIVVPASMTQPSQFSFYSDYSNAASLTSIGINSIGGVSYHFWRSDKPQHAITSANIYVR